MPAWQEYLQEGNPVPKWPYPILYEKENEVSADVLIIGGGIAGSHAAISAAKKGAKVAVVEKGMTKRSGSGGMGVDHWHGAMTNPCSRVTPEEFTRAVMDSAHGYACGPAWYIICKESWDTLLDCEKMGVQIRDLDDEFKGADFRDEETKLMFAYDYQNKTSIRVFGYNMKPCLYDEMKRLGVKIFDKVLVTSLLNEGGKQGNRIVGATGVNARTGEYYIFKAKAVIITTGRTGRLWEFAPEVIGSSAMGENDLNNAGLGQTIGWKAGAEFVLMERTEARSTLFSYAPYSVANANNTWYGAPIVDANGKEVSYVDKDGKELKTLKERFRPITGQKFTLDGGIGIQYRNPEFRGNLLDPKLPERIRKGEFVLPFYADLTRLPADERRVIFGMMVGNEGKTRIPVYDIYTKAGFDPDKDMLQAPVMSPEEYKSSYFTARNKIDDTRITTGGYLLDWDLRTSLEGLYSAGQCAGGAAAHAGAATSGRYAGRKAAEYAKTASEPVINRHQIDEDKQKVYKPIKPNKENLGWKELNGGIARVMQDYCGKHKSEETLKIGLESLQQLQEIGETSLYASNPHELGRSLEALELITCGELVIHSSLIHKASSAFLDFHRVDYPQMDPPDFQIFLPIRLDNNEVKTRQLPLDYHLKPPYAPNYEENYEIHKGSSK
jgi:succinate dehydrogenase/fumarate reductase flavoprotein subunit